MNSLTNEQIKQIIKDISDEECKEHNLETKIYGITPLEHYYKLFQDKEMKLSLTRLTHPLLAAGVFYNTTNEIIIYTNKPKKIKKIDRQIFCIIFTCYHELKHAIQEQTSDFSYDKFMALINSGDSPIPFVDYMLLDHDKYFCEIDANLYPIHKTKEYIKKKYPKEYELIKEELEKKEKTMNLNLAMHDASDIIERYHYKLKMLLKDENTTSISNLDEFPVLNIFWNDNLSYKSIKEIINNENFRKLDKRIIYAFFSTETFLETLNFEGLAYEELMILTEALEYTSNLYQKQADILLPVKESISCSSLKNIKSKITKLRKK